jgi:hypothetical protein
MASGKYQIIINMRVAEGYVETGWFDIGNDPVAATELAGQMQGDSELATTALLRLDLVEQEDGLSSVLQTTGCTLKEMSENVKLIIKETFRLINLEA